MGSTHCEGGNYGLFSPALCWRDVVGSLGGQARQRRLPSNASRRPCPGSWSGCGRVFRAVDGLDVGRQFVGKLPMISYAAARGGGARRQGRLPLGRLPPGILSPGSAAGNTGACKQNDAGENRSKLGPAPLDLKVVFQLAFCQCARLRKHITRSATSNGACPLRALARAHMYMCM